MEKVIFIIYSSHYSQELLNNYVERNTECRAFNFFNAEEILLYLNLNPSVIIYGENEYSFTNEVLNKINNSSKVSPLLMGVNKGFVKADRISKEGVMILNDYFPYQDIYRDLYNLCYADIKVGSLNDRA